MKKRMMIMSAKSSYRCFQLKVMGIIALALPVVAILLVMVIHGLPAPESISQTATIADKSDFLLPLSLGALALFSLTYSLKYAYNDKLERILTKLMCGGFLLVAVQKCFSDYLVADRIGLFYLTPEWSHIVHSIGAIIGFGSMILWIMLCFTKSDKPKKEQTTRKHLRNSIYYWLGWGMVASLGIFVFDIIGFFGTDFPVVFVVEWAMLGFGGIACIIKSGAILPDKEEK